MVVLKNNNPSIGNDAIALKASSNKFNDFANDARNYVANETLRAKKSVRETAASELSYRSRMMLNNWPSKDPEFQMTKPLSMIKELGETATVHLSSRDPELLLFGNERTVMPRSELEKKFEDLYGTVYKDAVFKLLKELNLMKDYKLKDAKGKQSTPMIGLTPLGAKLAEEFQRIARDLKLIREATDAHPASNPK
jgi:hypothetical protein